jgi:hypothetical protein
MMDQPAINLIDIGNSICQEIENGKPLNEVIKEIGRTNTYLGKVIVSQMVATCLADLFRYDEAIQLARQFNAEDCIYILATLINGDPRQKDHLYETIHKELSAISDQAIKDGMASIVAAKYSQVLDTESALKLIRKIKNQKLKAKCFIETLQKVDEMEDISALCMELDMLISSIERGPENEEERAYLYRLLAMYEIEHGLSEMARHTLDDIKVKHHHDQVKKALQGYLKDPARDASLDKTKRPDTLTQIPNDREIASLLKEINNTKQDLDKLNSTENMATKDDLNAKLASIYIKLNKIDETFNALNNIANLNIKISKYLNALERLKLTDNQLLERYLIQLKGLIDQIQPDHEGDDEQQYQYRLLAILLAKKGFESMTDDILSEIKIEFHKSMAIRDIKLASLKIND